MPPLLPVVRMVAHMQGGQMMEDMIAIELAHGSCPTLQTEKAHGTDGTGMGELPEEEQGKNGQEFDERAAETFFHEHRRKAHCRGVGKGSGRICGVSMSAG